MDLLIPASGSAEESVLDNKTYNIEKIKDLHSKLVLVSGKQELRIKIVNNFMEVRIPSVLPTLVLWAYNGAFNI